MLTNSRAASTTRPISRPPDWTTISRLRRSYARALEPEARAQVDDRHDLAAREHDAVDERRRVRHAGDVLDHLHVPDLAARQRVGRARHREQDVAPEPLRRLARASSRSPPCRRERSDPDARACAGRAPPDRESARRGRRRDRWRRKCPSTRDQRIGNGAHDDLALADDAIDGDAERRRRRCRPRTRAADRASCPAARTAAPSRTTGSAAPRYGVISLRSTCSSAATAPRRPREPSPAARRTSRSRPSRSARR